LGSTMEADPPGLIADRVELKCQNWLCQIGRE
jgi:hypothetical protein